MRNVLLLAAALATLGCPQSHGAPTSPGASAEDRSALRNDAGQACVRAHDGTTGMWTQIMFQTKTWNALAVDADQRDDVPRAKRARCEMGRLVERDGGESEDCTQLKKALFTDCE